MRIVLIDDDSDTHEFLIPFLKAHGFDTYSAYSGGEGLDLIRRYDPDLIILDIQLPEIDGWEICQRIRYQSNLPILMISAVAQEDEDVIRGLSLGADDYLLKPLRLNVFEARLKALLRRSMETTWRNDRQAYIDDHLMISLHRKQVSVNGRPVSLSSLEYLVLAMLVRNKGFVVSTLDLVDELWAESVNDDYARYIRVYIKRLRDIIEPDPQNPEYLINEHGVGYKFVPHNPTETHSSH